MRQKERPTLSLSLSLSLSLAFNKKYLQLTNKKINIINKRLLSGFNSSRLTS